MPLFGSTQRAFTVKDADTFGKPGIAYHAESDHRSWAAMRRLFAETIDRPGAG